MIDETERNAFKCFCKIEFGGVFQYDYDNPNKMNDDCAVIDIGFDTDDENIGTHYDFIVAFLTAFFLNWVGYITTFFINDSIATRSGGISGFGMSIVKVALIVQHIYEKDGVTSYNIVYDYCRSCVLYVRNV